MAVVSVKVQDEIKRQMEKYRDSIDWPEAIRGFIGDRIRQAEREANLNDVEGLLKGVPATPKGMASRLVREDRNARR